MAGFTKLVPEIVESSLWNEPSDIRIVWIYMLAKKDESGYVRGDVRTIARMANVPTESAERAIEIFQEPDSNSHTPDNDGRRIEAAPGGWIVLNHEIYRAQEDIRREKTRERVRKHREKQKSSVTERYSNVTPALPSVSVSASDTNNEYTSAFLHFWAIYPKKKSKRKAAKAFKTAVKRCPLEKMIEAVKKQSRWNDWTKDGGDYIPYPSSWLNADGWENEDRSAEKPRYRSVD